MEGWDWGKGNIDFQAHLQLQSSPYAEVLVKYDKKFLPAPLTIIISANRMEGMKKGRTKKKKSQIKNEQKNGSQTPACHKTTL
jgi:hypothetical protein